VTAQANQPPYRQRRLSAATAEGLPRRKCVTILPVV